MNKSVILVVFGLAVAFVVSGVMGQQCAPGMVWKDCGSACPEHCPTRDAVTGRLVDGLHVACIDMCVQGCQCDKGYVQDLKRNKQCVLRSECSAP